MLLVENVCLPLQPSSAISTSSLFLGVSPNDRQQRMLGNEELLRSFFDGNHGDIVDEVMS